MKKEISNEHLIYVLKKTTPYQRMLWLGKALKFWEKLNKQKLPYKRKKLRQHRKRTI